MQRRSLSPRSTSPCSRVPSTGRKIRCPRNRCNRSLREDHGRRIQDARQDRGRARPRGLPQGGDPAAQRCFRGRRLDPGPVRRIAGAEVSFFHASSPRKRGPILRVLSFWHSGGHYLSIQAAVVMGPRFRGDDNRLQAIETDLLCMDTDHKSASAAPSDDLHLIVAKDEEVVIEHYPEDWIAFVLFWSLAFIVFLQFFTRYILNDSLSWTEEIARYGLMWLAFIGGAVVTRKKTHIAVELLGNLMAPGRLRTSLFALVDFVTLGFMGLLAYFSISITDRMQAQTMTVFDLPMSLVYGGVAFGCFLMVIRQAVTVWSHARQRWQKADDFVHQLPID